MDVAQCEDCGCTIIVKFDDIVHLCDVCVRRRVAKELDQRCKDCGLRLRDMVSPCNVCTDKILQEGLTQTMSKPQQLDYFVEVNPVSTLSTQQDLTQRTVVDALRQAYRQKPAPSVWKVTVYYRSRAYAAAPEERVAIMSQEIEADTPQLAVAKFARNAVGVAVDA